MVQNGRPGLTWIYNIRWFFTYDSAVKPTCVCVYLHELSVFVYSAGNCVNEDGSLGCVRRTDEWLAVADTDNTVQPIWLDELTCSGNELELAECQRDNWGITDCGHKEDAGCTCRPRPTVSPVRGNYCSLRPSTFFCRGKLEKYRKKL
jgi:hypothetical protein